LYQVVSVSDPEWAPFWLNYKDLKRKIVRINKEIKKRKRSQSETVGELMKSDSEIVFFRELQGEVKKINEFFNAEEELYRIRKERTIQTFTMLEDSSYHLDDKMWTTLLVACLQFYKDVLFFENFAIMNYCGISKILKKHDKHTGFKTREAFMSNVVNKQNFSDHRTIDQMLRETEQIFNEVSSGRCTHSSLRAEETLFINAMHHLNYQASRLKAEEVLSLFSNLPTEHHSTHVIPSRSTAETPEHYPLHFHSSHHAHSSSSKCSMCPKVALDMASDELISVAMSSTHSPNLRNAVKWIQKLNSASFSPHVSDHEEEDEGHLS